MAGCIKCRKLQMYPVTFEQSQQGQHDSWCSRNLHPNTNFWFFFSTLEEVGAVLTLVKALLAVHDGNPVSAEAGGPVQLAVVLVQLPIGTAHGFIVGFTVIQALTLPLTRLVVDHTVMPQTAVLVFARAGEAMVSSDTCREHTENTCISLLSENLNCVSKVPYDMIIMWSSSNTSTL